jgi:MYXO-CTERM domain-containing protein
VVTAIDDTGKETSASVRFDVDATPPRVEVLDIVHGGVYGAGAAARIEATDANLVSVTATLDGVTYVSGDPVTVEGAHQLVVVARDAAGNETTGVGDFAINPQAPTIIVTGVDDGGIYAAAVLPEVTTDDPTNDVLVILLNDEPWDGGAVNEDGKHTLDVIATDPNGNEARLSVRFTIDSVPPQFVVVGVFDGGIYPNPVRPDVLLESDDVVEVTATIDGAAFALGSEVASEGTHELVVVIVDQAGNEVQITVGFTIDPNAPFITITGVDDGAYVRTPVTLDVSATPAGTALSVEIGGVSYTPGTEVSAEGRHVVRVSATAPNGTVAVAGLTFTLDATPPAITVAGVQADGYYAGDVYPRWVAEDEFLADVFAEGDGNFLAAGDPISGEGGHIFSVVARDLAGNETSVSVPFTIDVTPPVIAIAGVTEGEVGPGPFTPVVSVTESHPGTLLVTLDGEAFVSGTEVSAEGAHVLDVKAVDLAGNVSEASVNFTVEPARDVVVTVVRADVPVAAVEVHLHAADGSYTGDSTVTDEAGTAVFSDVDGGDYRARVHVGWDRFITPPLTSPGDAFVYSLPIEPIYDETFYVDGAASGGDGSEDSPFDDIGAALAVASFNSVVKVAGGTYDSADVAVPEGVTLRGGHAAGTWRFAPQDNPTVIERRMVDLTGVSHAVVADLHVTGSDGVGVRMINSGALVRDVMSTDNTEEGFLISEGNVDVINVLALRNGGAGVSAIDGDSHLEHVTSAHNGGDGIALTGGDVVRAVVRSILARNGGNGLVLEEGRAEEVLAGDNDADDFTGAAAAGLLDVGGNQVASPRFVRGAQHAVYLSQPAAGQSSQSPGVDSSYLEAAQLDLRGRTTASNGARDISALDLGFHAWPAGELPSLPPPGVPDGCNCSTQGDDLPSTALLAVMLAGIVLMRRRRGRR